MQNKLNQFSRLYEAGLSRHLIRSPNLKRARSLGIKALDAGLEILALVRIHDNALRRLEVLKDSKMKPEELIKAAGVFFYEVVTPIELTHRGARESALEFERLNRSLRSRTEELAASNEELKQEISRRVTIEIALKQSERHHCRLLGESKLLQEQLRFLSHQILSAQEEERKRISRELHDDIAATLSVINIELAALKREATGNNRELKRKIVNTQRLVQNSVEVIHRFARDLRPTTLDDLGLIPALHSFSKTLSKQAGLRIRLTAFAGVEALDNAQRTVLYRVSQEALTNVAKHASATRADVTIAKLNGSVSLKIADDGKSFNVDRRLSSRKKNRLGLLGMRERVEMVGGTFAVESSPAKGTTIQATIPFLIKDANGHNGKSNGKLRVKS
jgi:signal transduction histidine kinase